MSYPWCRRLGAGAGAGADEDDAHAYAEGIHRGGALVAVRASDAEVDRIIDILDDKGTVDFDERETTWRSEGWSGASSSYPSSRRSCPTQSASSRWTGPAD